MGELRMRLRTETQKLGGNILIGWRGFRQIVEFQDICEWFEHGLDSNAMGNDLKAFDLVKNVKS